MVLESMQGGANTFRAGERPGVGIKAVRYNGTRKKQEVVKPGNEAVNTKCCHRGCKVQGDTNHMIWKLSVFG